MDTSEQYVKMCEKATEIQSAYEQEDARKSACHCRDYPEWVSIPSKGKMCPDHGNMGGNFCSWCARPLIDRQVEWSTYYTTCKGSNEVWLPRQDQLQEILGVKLPANGLFAISEWCQKMNYLEHQRVNGVLASSCPYFSMEQLWLAFVMREKYGKVWSGKDWEPG